MNSTDQVLSLPRMARRLGVTQHWLREMAIVGNVPCLQAGKRLLFHPATVEASIARLAGSQQANAKPTRPESEVPRG